MAPECLRVSSYNTTSTKPKQTETICIKSDDASDREWALASLRVKPRLKRRGNSQKKKKKEKKKKKRKEKEELKSRQDDTGNQP